MNWNVTLLTYIVILGSLLSSHRIVAQSPSITFTPDVEELDLGSTQVNTYTSPHKIMVKISPLGGYGEHNYTFSFESEQKDNFLVYGGYFDSDSESATLTIYLHPRTPGLKEGFAVLKNGKEELRRIRVFGTGLGDSDPEIITDYKLLEYGKVIIGKTYTKEVLVTTKNSGSTITTGIEGTGQSAFSIQGVIQPNQEEQKLIITCAPTSPGELSATLCLKDGSTEVKVPISALAEAPPVSLSSDSSEVHFEDTYIGQTSTKEIVIHMANVVEAPIIRLLDNEHSFFSVEGTLDPNMSEGKLLVKFTPSEEVEASSKLIITSGNCSIEVFLYANGYEDKVPEIQVSRAKVDFGRIKINNFVVDSLHVVIKHTSEIPTLTIEGNEHNVFSIFTQPLSKQFLLKVNCLPDSIGVYDATILLRVKEVECRIPIHLVAYSEKESLTTDRSTIEFIPTEVGYKSPEYGVNVTMIDLSSDVQVSIEGPDAGEFIASKKKIERIAADGYVGVVFSPQTEGTKTAKLVLRSGVLKTEVKLIATSTVHITDANRTGGLISTQDGLLYVHVVDLGQTLRIYTHQGIVVYESILYEPTTSIDLSSGTYLVTYGDEVSRVIL